MNTGPVFEWWSEYQTTILRPDKYLVAKKVFSLNYFIKMGNDESNKSRAASSVGVMYHFSGPNTGSNPLGGWILNLKKSPS